ncbi:MAG: rhodanese-like domain-containing protein [Gammaproteobacteria bacterium]|jgi:phage shock protein E|nr:rhodanese-like domain-containing protein [Gammaproteobacteria bacterium]
MMMDQTLRCEEARRLLAEGARLVDVRTPEEYYSGALDGALNLPLENLTGAHGLLDKASPIVLYCGTGQRSDAARRLLQEAGFARVHDLGSMHNLHRC